MSKYKNSSHCKHNISYHIVWIPKYRKRIIVTDVEDRLKELILNKADLLNIKIGAIECMPDHIHLFVKANTNTVISYVVKILKGYTSKILREEFTHLTITKHLWAVGYFCETIGNINEQTVIRYINNQKTA